MIRCSERLRSLAAASLSAALLLAAAPCAHAEEPARGYSAENLATARDAIKEGLALREKGDIEGAFSKLHLAHTLVATPVTSYELGKTYMMMGQLLSARELFIEVGRMPRSTEESDRSETARRESARLAEELEPLIPRLRFKLTLPPLATAVVKVDGVVVNQEAVAAPRRVNPGAHEISAKAGDGPEQMVKVDVKENESKDVELAPQWVPPKAPPIPERPYYVKTTPNSVALYGGIVATGLGLVIGTGSLVAWQIKISDFDHACSGSYCPPSSKADADQLQTAAVTMIIGYGLAGLGVTAAVLGFAIPRKEKVYTGLQPLVGPSSVGLRGTF